MFTDEVQEVTRHVRLSDECWQSISPATLNDSGQAEIGNYLRRNRMQELTESRSADEDGVWIDVELTRDGVTAVCFSPFVYEHGVRVSPNTGMRQNRRFDMRDNRSQGRFQKPRRPLQPIDFSRYNWDKFVGLIDDLEKKLPFIGVKYLATKVLGTRNCGYGHPSHRRDIIRQAREMGIITVTATENVGGKADPVSTCKLNRENEIVVKALAMRMSTNVIGSIDEGVSTT